MYRAVIIDDEEPARAIIREYLEKFPDIEIAGEFSNGFNGIKGIQETDAHLVFLDIQMPKLTGFEMLELMDERPEIIFVTAYDQYAIKAFEENAVDYLLKPFSFPRFNEAVQKAISRMRTGEGQDSRRKLEEHADNQVDILSRIVVKNRNDIVIIPTDRVIYLEAQDDYVMIYLKDAKYLKQKTMKYFESRLDPHQFIRVHRSYIVRVDQISKIESYDKAGSIILLKDGRTVPVSRSGLGNIKEMLDI